MSNLTLHRNANGESYNDLVGETTDTTESEMEIKKKRGQPRQKRELRLQLKQITDEIHSLRNYYSAERGKEEAASRKSGSGRDDLYTSK